jgi:hypothetical protein
MKHFLPILALCLAACTSSDKQSNSGRVGAQSEVGPGGMALAPFPYTPEAIRDRCVEGLVLTFRVVSRGQQPVIQHMRFHDWDMAGVKVEIRRETPEGKSLGGVSDTHSTWTSLRDHASFPSAATVRLREKLTTPAGEWDCWVYVVVGPDGGTTRFWFADQLPGPPVLLDQEQDGERIMRMELIKAYLP